MLSEHQINRLSAQIEIVETNLAIRFVYFENLRKSRSWQVISHRGEFIAIEKKNQESHRAVDRQQLSVRILVSDE